MRMHVPVVFLAASCMTATASSNTLFPSLEQKREAEYGIGLGVLAEDEGYRNVGTEVEPVPILYVRTERMRILGPQLTYRILGTPENHVGLRVDYRMDGFDADDADIFRGMDKRKGSPALGFAGKIDTGAGELHYSVAKAATASKGMYGTLQMAWPMRAGSWVVTPRAGVEYFDRKYSDYYFGVRPHEARPDRRAYTLSGTVNLDAGIDLQRAIGLNHLALASVKYRRYGDDIRNSPLIGKGGSPRFNVGYIYRF